MTEIALRIGLTPEHGCSYLPGESEQLMVLLDRPITKSRSYEHLPSPDFGAAYVIFTDHTARCGACRSLRMRSLGFVPTRSQRRVQHQNRDIRLLLSSQDKRSTTTSSPTTSNERHFDGSMFPATRNQYDGFNAP